MADKNQLKVADQVDLADDDPFAELTRIMGFDPRQPVRPADAPQPASVAQAAGDDDFSLDLEKELLGGFDLEDELADTDNAPAESAAPAHETPAPETLDAAPEPEATAFDIPAAEMPEVDFDFSADFDAAMAASDEDGAAAADADFDLGLTEDDVRALDVPESREQPAADVKTAVDAEADFDLGLTMDDVRALDAETAQSTASSKADAANWNAGRGDADDRDIDADLDAALADIDMDFLRDAAAPEPATPEPVDEAPAVLQDEDAGEADLHLFDEEDFRFDDIAASAVEAEPEPEQESEPESHESVLSFGEDDLRLDDAHPAGEQSAQLAEEESSFDDADFMADLSVSTEPKAEESEAAWPESVEVETAAPEIYQPEPVAEEPPAAAEPDLSVQAEPASAQHFELPRYEPRKLPVSPMDVAAEEFRQREAAVAPAAPEFNLEDELNALLGNIRAGQQEASSPAAPVSEPEPFVASSYAPPAYEPPPADLHQPAASSTYETGPYETGSFEASHPAVEPQHGHASEPISFDAPSEPADIEDNLSWELDDAFAADGGPEQAEDEQPTYGLTEAYAQGDHPEAYAQDGRHDPYAEAGQIDDAYSVEEPAPDFVDET
ncbi:MAG: hypothetical protein M3Y43_06420, partial [Pseudomonadota bacterium]|nr:hypothetical protein [Pseudomonadota bacterium]